MCRTVSRCILALSAAAAVAVAGCERSAPPPAQSTEQAKPAPAAPPPAAPAAPPAPAPSVQPALPVEGQPVNADARALETMLERINDYAALHKKIEDTLPKLSDETTPEKIDKNQRALGRLIQEQRRGAKPGDIFTPDAQAVIKRLLARVFAGPEGAALRASIMDENPGPIKLKVNSRYPDTIPLSTVPPQVLQGLPKLPEEMEYRFIGPHLILMDVHAHIIVDLIEHALPS
jgi:hypothetical protein